MTQHLPDQSLLSRYRTNAAVGVASLLATAMLSLVFTAFLISNLGVSQYGLWALGFSVVQFTIILDLGLLSTVRRFQSRAIARGDLEESNAVLGTSLLLYIPVGLIAMAVVASGGFWVPLVVDIPESAISDFRFFMYALGVYILIFFIRSSFSGILFGANRVDLDRLLTVVQRTTMVIASIALLLRWRSSLSAPAIGVVIGISASLALAVLLSRRVIRGSRMKMPQDSSLARSMVKFSSGVLLMTFGGAILLYFPPLAVGHALGTEAVAYLAIALLMVGYLIQMMQALSAPLFPVATRYETSRHESDLTGLYIRSTRTAVLVSVVVSITIAIYASDIIRLWINDEFAWVGELVAILLIGSVFRHAAMPGRHILTATRSIFGLGVAELATGITTAIGLVVILGFTETDLWGVAWVITAMTVGFSGVFVPAYACRQLHLPAIRTWVAVYGGTLLFGVPYLALAAYVRLQVGPTSTLEVSLVSLATLAAGLVGGGLIVLSRSERDVIRRLVRPGTSHGSEGVNSETVA